MSLPADEAERLNQLRASSDLPHLRLRVRRLREHGWSLASIARSLDTYRSTVRNWSLHPNYAQTRSVDVPVPPHALIPRLLIDPSRFDPQVELPLLGVTGIAPRLSRHDAVLLRTLSQDARRVRGHTATNARSRTSARKFDVLLHEQRSRGVTIQELAVASNLTTRAVRGRITTPLSRRLAIVDSDPTSELFLLVWEAPSLNKRWRTFVLQGSRKPMVFSPGLVQFPAVLPSFYHVLTPNEAESQLGWPVAEMVYFPQPL